LYIYPASGRKKNLNFTSVSRRRLRAANKDKILEGNIRRLGAGFRHPGKFSYLA